MRCLRRAVLILALTAAPATAQGVIPDLGWLSDGRRFVEGDIITIVVDEFTSASADRATSAREDRTSDVAAGFRSFGAGSATGQDVDLGTLLASQSSQRGRDVRQDRMSSEVSVRVLSVEPNGTLRIEGTKKVVIDEHEQEVTVRGAVRPQDISSANTVESWRVAEAEVLYATDGSLAQADKSFIMKILGWIIP